MREPHSASHITDAGRKFVLMKCRMVQVYATAKGNTRWLVVWPGVARKRCQALAGRPIGNGYMAVSCWKSSTLLFDQGS